MIDLNNICNGLKNGKHYNYRLQNDYNIYGKDSFVYKIIEEVNDNIAFEREDYWMDYYGGINSTQVYNMQKHHSKNDEYKVRKSIAYTGNHPNHFKGMTHEQIYGKEKAESMRKSNSDKHKGRPATYIPHKGKVKLLDGSYLVVTEQMVKYIHKLRRDGYTYQQIIDDTNIGYSGVFNILKNRINIL